MSQLIGATPTVSISCKAFFEENGKKVTVPFITEYTRLSREDNKKLHTEIESSLASLRQIARQLSLLELDKVCLDESGNIVIFDSNHQDDDSLKILSEEQKLEKREALKEKLLESDKSAFERLKASVHNISDLKGQDKKVIPYSPELLDEMLANDGYFKALQTGLMKSTGSYENQKAKN